MIANIYCKTAVPAQKIWYDDKDRRINSCLTWQIKRSFCFNQIVVYSSFPNITFANPEINRNQQRTKRELNQILYNN